jgi:hypothetical protein
MFLIGRGRYGHLLLFEERRIFGVCTGPELSLRFTSIVSLRLSTALFMGLCMGFCMGLFMGSTSQAPFKCPFLFFTSIASLQEFDFLRLPAMASPWKSWRAFLTLTTPILARFTSFWGVLDSGLELKSLTFASTELLFPATKYCTPGASGAGRRFDAIV